LNCSIDDIDLLSSTLSEKNQIKHNNDGLFALADNDNDDLVVIHTKRMLIEEKLRQENAHLLDINRRLEQQKDECKAKFDLLDFKSNEYIKKVQNDMQVRKYLKKNFKGLSRMGAAHPKIYSRFHKRLEVKIFLASSPSQNFNRPPEK
jgi:hypothetical protein